MVMSKSTIADGVTLLFGLWRRFYMAYRRLQANKSFLRLTGEELPWRIPRHKCMRCHMNQTISLSIFNHLSTQRPVLVSLNTQYLTLTCTCRSLFCTRWSFTAQVRILNSILQLPPMQNRALQTRAQPTPLSTCARAVCGVSSK